MSEDLSHDDAHWQRDIAFSSLFVASLVVAISLAVLGFGI